jgi:hypothetical protein
VHARGLDFYKSPGRLPRAVIRHRLFSGTQSEPDHKSRLGMRTTSTSKKVKTNPATGRKTNTGVDLVDIQHGARVEFRRINKHVGLKN